MLKKKYPAYVSKHNSNRKKQFILLMILNGYGWYHFAVKILSALLREITFLFPFITLEQKANLNHIKNNVKIKVFGIL